jgi:hypothetical protein
MWFNKILMAVVGVGSIWAGIVTSTAFIVIGGIAFVVIALPLWKNNDSN